MKSVVVIGFICLPICNAMSPTEATFKCKISIAKAEDVHSALVDSDLKKIAKTAISLMNKILEELSHRGGSKDLPTKTHQCVQHAEHVAWLKENVEPAIQRTKSELKSASQKTSSEPENTKSKSSLKKKSKREEKKEEKKIEINQRNLDLKSLEKILKSEKNSESTEASKSAPTVLTPTL